MEMQVVRMIATASAAAAAATAAMCDEARRTVRSLHGKHRELRGQLRIAVIEGIRGGTRAGC